MKSCAVQRVVLATFKGLMVAFVVLDLPLLVDLAGEPLVGLLMALVTLASFAGTDLVFVFSDVDAADLDTDADGRAMVNSFLKW
jgi:hypothetical protein